MSAARTFSDEEITAYLDGEADAELVQEIDAGLESNPDLVAHIESLSFPKDLLPGIFDMQLAAAPEMPPLPERVVPPAPRLGWRGFAPGIGVGLAAGLAIAMFSGLGQTKQQAEPGWLEIVANYQMLYVPATLEPPRRLPSGPGGQGGGYTTDLVGLSKVIDLDLTTLRNVEGLTFRRAQQLGFNGKPLIQIAYTLADGTPVAICILPSQKGETGQTTRELRGMAATDWTTSSHGVLIIGGDDQSFIKGIADKVQPLI